MEEVKRRRKKNFTDTEIRCLLQEINIEKALLLSKMQSSLTMRRKRETWQRIASNVTASGGVLRSIDDVKKKWKDLKAEAMTLKTGDKLQDGNIPPGRKPPFLEYIMSILEDSSGSIPVESNGDYIVTFQDPLAAANDPIKTEVPVILSVQTSTMAPRQQRETIDVDLLKSAAFSADIVTNQPHSDGSRATSPYFNISSSPSRLRQETLPDRGKPHSVTQAFTINRKPSKLYVEVEDADLLNEYIRSCIRRNKKEEELMELKCKKLRKELGVGENSGCL